MEKIKKIIQEEVSKVLDTKLTESGFPRIANILTARVPSVKAIGIITPENPCGENKNQAENNDLLKDIKEYLKNYHARYVQIKGKFGNSEKPFILFNISKKDLIEIGKKYKQKSVIFGELQKNASEEQKGYYKFEYIKLWSDDKCESFSPIVTDTRYGILFDKSIQGKDDFYTWVKGRKFVIPFFDEDNKLQSPPKSNIDEILKRTFNNIIIESEHITDLFLLENVPDDEESKKIIEEINWMTNQLLGDNHTGKSKWHNRCIIEVNLKKLRALEEGKK
jgi:hypothetical protein